MHNWLIIYMCIVNNYIDRLVRKEPNIQLVNDAKGRYVTQSYFFYIRVYHWNTENFKRDKMETKCSHSINDLRLYFNIIIKI